MSTTPIISALNLTVTFTFAHVLLPAYELIEFHRRNRDREIIQMRRLRQGSVGSVGGGGGGGVVFGGGGEAMVVRDGGRVRSRRSSDDVMMEEGLSSHDDVEGEGEGGNHVGILTSLSTLHASASNVILPHSRRRTNSITPSTSTNTPTTTMAHTPITAATATAISPTAITLQFPPTDPLASSALFTTSTPTLTPISTPMTARIPPTPTPTPTSRSIECSPNVSSNIIQVTREGSTIQARHENSTISVASTQSSTRLLLNVVQSAATAATSALRRYSLTGSVDDSQAQVVPDSCIICFARDTDSCLLECGHVIMCFPCAAMVAKQMPNACPLCRVPIRYIVKITTPAFALKDGRMLAVSGEGYVVRTDVVSAFVNATGRRRSATGTRPRERTREVANLNAPLPTPPLEVELPLIPPVVPSETAPEMIADPTFSLV